jgi:hypothetical protein
MNEVAPIVYWSRAHALVATMNVTSWKWRSARENTIIVAHDFIERSVISEG